MSNNFEDFEMELDLVQNNEISIENLDEYLEIFNLEMPDVPSDIFDVVNEPSPLKKSNSLVFIAMENELDQEHGIRNPIYEDGSVWEAASSISEFDLLSDGKHPNKINCRLSKEDLPGNPSQQIKTSSGNSLIPGEEFEIGSLPVNEVLEVGLLGEVLGVAIPTEELKDKIPVEKELLDGISPNNSESSKQHTTDCKSNENESVHKFYCNCSNRRCFGKMSQIFKKDVRTWLWKSSDRNTRMHEFMGKYISKNDSLTKLIEDVAKRYEFTK